ncbi:MAG: hypothetical protein MK212_03490 [Saprospiraceae bacterium]|nr:hypothetical protein [Saprospiraceae bacterium]
MSYSKNILALAALFISAASLAQSFGEDLTQYAIRNNLRAAQKGSERGLSKNFLFRNYTQFVVNSISHKLHSNQYSFEELNLSFNKASHEQFSWQYGSYNINEYALDLAGSHFGELDFGAAGLVNIFQAGTKHTHLAAFVDGTFNNFNPIDLNKDNFLDVPLKKRMHGQVEYFTQKEKKIYGKFFDFDYNSTYVVQAEHMWVDQQEGALNIPLTDIATDSAFGIRRKLQYSKLNFVNNHQIKKKYKSDYNYRFNKINEHYILTYLHGVWADQNQQFAQRNYDTKERNILGGLNYNYEFRVGRPQLISFGLHTEYRWQNQRIDSTDYLRKTLIIGQEAGGELNITDWLRLQGYLRTDYHSNLGLVLLPNFGMHIKFPLYNRHNVDLRMAANRGTRIVDPLAEWTNFLYSNRNIILPNQLMIEKMWNFGGSLGYSYSQERVSFYLGASFYSWQYQQALVVDASNDAQSVRFFTSNDLNFRHKLNAYFSIHSRKAQSYFHFKYTYHLAQQTLDGQLMNRYLHVPHQWNFNYHFNFRKWDDFYLSCNYLVQSAQTLPDMTGKLNDFGATSPWTHRLDAKVALPMHQLLKSDKFRKRIRIWTFYFEVENILNDRQNLLFAGTANSSDPNFDASAQWGYTAGRRFVLGTNFIFR